jgi:hypothetical protein
MAVYISLYVEYYLTRKCDRTRIVKVVNSKYDYLLTPSSITYNQQRQKTLQDVSSEAPCGDQTEKYPTKLHGQLIP